MVQKCRQNVNIADDTVPRKCYRSKSREIFLVFLNSWRKSCDFWYQTISARIGSFFISVSTPTMRRRFSALETAMCIRFSYRSDMESWPHPLKIIPHLRLIVPLADRPGTQGIRAVEVLS